MDQLEEKDFHNNPSAESNSIAIIIQHMHGNMMSRWTNFLTEDGEKEWRKRDDEFEEHPLSRQELINRWNEGWKVLMDSLESLKEDDLEKTITITSQPLIVTDAPGKASPFSSVTVPVIIRFWPNANAANSISIVNSDAIFLM